MTVQGRITEQYGLLQQCKHEFYCGPALLKAFQPTSLRYIGLWERKFTFSSWHPSKECDHVFRSAYHPLWKWSMITFTYSVSLTVGSLDLRTCDQMDRRCWVGCLSLSWAELMVMPFRAIPMWWCASYMFNLCLSVVATCDARQLVQLVCHSTTCLEKSCLELSIHSNLTQWVSLWCSQAMVVTISRTSLGYMQRYWVVAAFLPSCIHLSI